MLKSIQSIQLGEPELNSRLGRHQLALSLGDHLIRLGIDYSPTILRGVSSHELPASYTSYQELKAENSKEFSDYTDIWISYILVLGVKWTSHSAVLGRHSMPSVPRTTTLENPLDLRSQGYARHSVRMSLLRQCVNFAASSPTSPLLDRPNLSSLTIVLSIISSAHNWSIESVKPLLRLAVECFRQICLQAQTVEVRGTEEFESCFESLFVFDISVNTACGDPPALTDAEIQTALQNLDVDPELYIDPFYFYLHQERLLSQWPYAGEINAWTIRRRFAFSSDKIKQGVVSEEEAQHLCLEMIQLCANFRLWRESTFEIITESLQGIKNREQAHLRSSTGEENFTTSIMIQSRECKTVFMVASLLQTCRELWPDNRAFVEMAQAVDLACDQQIHLILDAFDIVLRRNMVLPRPMLDDGFSGKLIHMFGSSFQPGYLFLWSRRFPERKALIHRLMVILKHLSFFAIDVAEQATVQEELEAAALREELMVLHSLPSTSIPDAEHFNHLETLNSIVTSPFDPSPDGIRSYLKSPSPSIVDFSDTLNAVIAPPAMSTGCD
ncbi:hypothetical protein BT69DRAFT_1347926 [Atractiella rhizophila]|nr:hypothetical protein BT69DRAFT_1347926 [Atractiella rhizophila]